MILESLSSQQKYTSQPISKYNYGRQVINPDLWRMNSIEYDHRRSQLYMMCCNEIKCLPIPDLSLDKVNRLSSLKLYDELDAINQIQVNQNNPQLEILVAVTMQGMVYVYDLSDTSLKPIVLNNQYPDKEDCSTWSVDIHCKDSTYLLAVGSNSMIISLWNLANLDILLINTQNKASAQLNCPPQIQQEYQLLSNTQYDLFPSRYSISEHAHNIPCIKFSPCGLYLGSVNIVHQLILFTVATGKLLMKFDLMDQGWALEWITRQDSTNEYILAIGMSRDLLLLDITKDGIILLDRHRKTAVNNHYRYSLLRYIPQMRILVAVLQNSECVEYYHIDAQQTMVKQKVSRFPGTHLQGVCVRYIPSMMIGYALVILLGYDGQVFINKLQLDTNDDSLIDLSQCSL